MRKFSPSAVILAIALLTLAACNKEGGGKKGPLAKADPIELALPAKVQTDNTFAFDLFRTTCENTDGNAFISPLSMSMALNMVLNGAEEETREQMLEALRAEGYTPDQINSHSKELREALLAVDPSTALDIVNAIWYKKGFPVKAPFIATNKSYYAAEVAELDFNDEAKALATINGWCKTNTKGRIEKVLDNISPDLVMVLANAIYFKGIWVSQFDKNDTAKEDFHAAGGQTRRVDMMRQTSDFKYDRDENCAYLELPYGNQAFSIVLMLPDEGTTPDEVAARLDNEFWSELPKRMQSVEVNLRLPRLKAECTFQMHEKILPEMGMVLPFDKENADFSGIYDPEPGENLYISFVIHKTFLEINEEGTEAAAVTVVGGDLTTALPRETSFIVDRPFILAIRENSTGAILFMGRIDDIQ